jgi:excisionase family DNA binding protein
MAQLPDGHEVVGVTEDSWLPVREAMALCHVSRRTIYYWLAQGRLTVMRTAGGRLRILASSLFRDEARQPLAGSPDGPAI